jgi:hypothetical protein
LSNPPVVVKHISKNHIRITPSDGWSVTMFNVADTVEAFVSSDDGMETLRLHFERPGVGQTVVIKSVGDDGARDILYATRGPDGTLS